MSPRNLLFFILIFPVLAHSSVLFDGDDQFDCNSPYNGEKYFTLSAQIKTYNDNEQTQVIASYGNSHAASSLYEMRIELDPDTGSGFTVFCEFTDVGGSLQSVYADCGTPGYCMELNKPYHLACVLTNDLDLIPYINGEAYTPLATGTTLDSTYTGNFYIGMDAYGNNPAIDTEISDVTLYSDSLEPPLIETLGFSFMRNNIVSTDIRRAYWPLDDLVDGTNVGTTLMVDRSGNNFPCSAGGETQGGTAKADWVRYK